MELIFEPDVIINGCYVYDIELNKQHYFNRFDRQAISNKLHCHISEVPLEPVDFTIITITGSNTIEIRTQGEIL